MTKNEAITFTRRLMMKSEALHLATVDSEGNPQIRAMVNLRNPSNYPDLIPFFTNHRQPLEVFIATDSKSEKSAQIHRNRRVAVYFSIPVLFYGVMLAGTMEPVNDPTIKQALWQEGWKIYFPDGWKDPVYEVFSMNPERMKGWNNSSVFDFPLGDNRQ
jgi:general stress protein 26